MPQNDVIAAFQEYKERLLSFVRTRIGVQEDAEDLVQEIFYQLSRMDNLVKPVEQTAAWLFRVARNMISNWKKKKRELSFSRLAPMDEENPEELQDLMDFLAADETTPETEILRSFVWEEIEAALEELPVSQRDIFIETEFLGIPVKEIAKKTAIPVNTLLSRKHYAVVYLRKRLQHIYADFLGTPKGI